MKTIIEIIVNISSTQDVMRTPAHLGIVKGVGYSRQLVYGPHDNDPVVPQQ